MARSVNSRTSENDPIVSAKWMCPKEGFGERKLGETQRHHCAISVLYPCISE